MADDSAFVFNVPTNVSFTNDSDEFDENVDRYFNINNENNPPSDQPDTTNSSRLDERSMYFSPNLMYELGEYETIEMRRSMSVGNLIMFSESEDRKEENSAVERVREGINNLHMQQSSLIDQQSHYEKDSATLERHGLRNLQRLAHNKRYESAEKLAKSNPDKYVSFAEAVHQFQTRTPVRFRSKPNVSVDSDFHNVPLQLTYAQSPCLQTKARSRPTGNIQSTMERELMEFENIRKFKIKARPANKKILQGPIKPQVPVEKRPHTVLQPFNITQVPTKKVVPSSPKFIFHARPAPKPKTPQDTSQSRAATVQSLKNCNSKQQRQSSLRSRHDEKPLEKTVPMPFSFEQRDKMVQRKRDQYIQKILHEEKRAREFYAKPVPKAIYKKSDGLRRNSASSTDSSKLCDQSSTDRRCTEFRARPATVLRKEPFVPVPTAKPPTEPVPFHLESELRRQEREEFEMQKRLKEEQLAMLRKELEENQLRLENQEALRLRKETEYKAQPIKSFKPLVIKPSGKVTVPVSPKMYKKQLD